MQTSSSRIYPDSQTLVAGLRSVFSRNGFGGDQLTILDREPAVYVSSFPSEVVTCRFNYGSELRLFCKYASAWKYAYRLIHQAHGHRRGVAYEVDVYRHVLQPLQASTPTFYGAHTDATSGQTWLILEYLDGSVRASTGFPHLVTMSSAARWIGRFHAANEAGLESATMPFLNRYDARYYRGWARRTSRFASCLDQRAPWIATLFERFEDCVAALLAAPQTVIHGEYYPHNILCHDRIVHPVDWESASIAAGEIDLATLTEDWGAEVIQACELEYQRARWPAGTPTDFARTLSAARLYVVFRWLGERRVWTTPEDRLWCLERLHSASKRLGLDHVNNTH